MEYLLGISSTRLHLIVSSELISQQKYLHAIATRGYDRATLVLRQRYGVARL